jgi:energy-coupling factor transporter ATP-binding protein EcfA2
MLRGRPLYDTEADSAYFVAPSEWDTLLRAVAHRNNVLVTGARGSGKTSLLRQLEYELRKRDEHVTFVDGTAVSSTDELATRVRVALCGPPAAEGLLAELELVNGAPENVILVDGSGSADAVYGLFGRMRDTLWRMGHRWVIAVDDQERFTVLKPPADAFFDTVIDLEPMPSDVLVELVRRRDPLRELDDESLSEIAAAASGVPRAALRAANAALISGRRPRDEVSDRDRLLAAAGRIGQPHRALMAELLDLGQASPSDDALQNRLGLTRGRITALLRALLEEDLVEAGRDRSSGPGRPKTIYRPRITPAR